MEEGTNKIYENGGTLEMICDRVMAADLRLDFSCDQPGKEETLRLPKKRLVVEEILSRHIHLWMRQMRKSTKSNLFILARSRNFRISGAESTVYFSKSASRVWTHRE